MDAFVFTLSNTNGVPPTKFSLLPDSKYTLALYNALSHGPYFHLAFVIKDNSNTTAKSLSRLGSNFELPAGLIADTPEAKNFLAGSEYFVPDEIEVFYMGMYSDCIRK